MSQVREEGGMLWEIDIKMSSVAEAMHFSRAPCTNLPLYARIF